MRAILWVALTLWAAGAMWAGFAAVLAAHAPSSALIIAPGQPQALARLLTQTRDEASPWLTAQAEALLRAAPLSDLPLAYIGAASLSAGRLEEAVGLFDAALARNPRREASLALRASAAFAQNDTVEALTKLARLVVLDQNPERRGQYLEAIAALSESPSGRAWLLSEAFAADQAAPAILAHLNGRHSDLSLLLALNQSNPAGQAALVERGLRERGPRIAFIMWLSLLPEELNGAFAWPFNPGFEAIAAPPPFNWRLDNQGLSRNADRELVVSYSGRGRQSFLGQFMLLRPGLYRFTGTISGDGQVRGGGYVWEIACAGGGAVIGRTLRAGHRGGPSRVEATFEVPETGCEGQTLTLIGAPGEFPMRVRATLGPVAIAEIEP
jgi:tetratricopeptide (TPR) repeat protein